MDIASKEVAFPVLTDAEIARIAPMGIHTVVADGTVVFRAGQADLNLYIVESGEMEIVNPHDNRRITLHVAGEFAGDIDLLTRRPTVVTAIARGETHLIQVPSEKVRELLLRHPQIGEKLPRRASRQASSSDCAGQYRIEGIWRCRVPGNKSNSESSL